MCRREGQTYPTPLSQFSPIAAPLAASSQAPTAPCPPASALGPNPLLFYDELHLERQAQVAFLQLPSRHPLLHRHSHFLLLSLKEEASPRLGFVLQGEPPLPRYHSRYHWGEACLLSQLDRLHDGEN